MADQLATVSKSRLSQKMGGLSQADMEEPERAIRVQLALVL
ncbi:MAG TPA: type II toxin-antitoxin system PemK/MazF family toxin [Thermoanaerobaculia bacterium]|nr:type II toxin-antitoxin system PemK/MazF family toxin [Thermoanaerobaculia bacterium]